ncbi:MAG: DEAD/DEAH box helicase [Chloroflexota bacterium]
MSFTDFHLNDTLMRAVRERGFEDPTPVQQHAIPAALLGRDVVGTAQTGTGKTVAYLLPSMQSLLNGASPKHPRMLVLAPTRELAIQIADEAQGLSRYTRIRVVAIFGGAGIQDQATRLRRGVDLVVATPGRLLDHMQRGNVRFEALKILVLDEADRMLDMGFLPDITKILRQMPARRQTLLFSATMPQAILSLSQRFLNNPARIEIATARPPESILQQLYPVPKHLKNALLTALLKGKSVASALVFTRTKRRADVLGRKLREAGHSVAVIHGDFRQQKRIQSLERFRSGKARILVATNLAARGLDIEGISHVINFDTPDEAEDYVHRIGRTARVEAEGVAWTLVTQEDEPLIAGIEHLLGQKLERVHHPDFNYDVPTPDWAKPSAKTILRNARRNQSPFDRWRALTR